MLPHVVSRSSAGPFRNFFRFEFCDCERLIKPWLRQLFLSLWQLFLSVKGSVARALRWDGRSDFQYLPWLPCWLPDITEPCLVVNSGDIRSRYSTSRSNGPYPCQQPSGYSMDDSDLQNLSETWHSRARECRTAAERFRSSDARQRMLTAARDFDRMAQARDDALVKIDPTQGSGSV